MGDVTNGVSGAAQESTFRLTGLRRGATAQISGVDPATSGAVARRLRDMGLRAGVTVRCLRRAPLGSPTLYRVGESDLCLRRAETDQIAVEVRA